MNLWKIYHIQNGMMGKKIHQEWLKLECKENTLTIKPVASSRCKGYVIRNNPQQYFRLPQAVTEYYDLRNRDVKVDIRNDGTIIFLATGNGTWIEPPTKPTCRTPGKPTDMVANKQVTCEDGWLTICHNTDEVAIELHRERGAWIKVRHHATETEDVLETYQHYYGKELEMYPYPALTYRTGNNEILIPTWFSEGLIAHKRNLVFQEYQTKSDDILVPIQECQITGNPINYFQCRPKIIEFSAKEYDAYNEIRKIIKQKRINREKYRTIRTNMNRNR